MPTRDSAPIGAPCWIDLSTSDPERSRAFYSELLGWQAEEPSEEFGGYFMFTREGAPMAGGMPRAEGTPGPDAWTVYLATDDVAKTLELAAANGGQVLVDAMPVADLGTMALMTDAGGAVVGAWQPDTFHGFAVVAETGAPSWFEVLTRDYDATLAFYREVFRWEIHAVSDSGEMRYSTMRHGEDWHAGVMDASGVLPEGVPAHWAVYFGVADTDATLARAVELGATVVQPAEDTPYGRLAAVTDPTGSLFKLVAPNEAMPANG